MAKIIVEYVQISELREWPDNPRRHDVEAIRRSMERFGVRWPIIINRRTMQVEAGHGRLKALRELGETQAPVIFVDDDDLTARAFSIADNRTQDLTEWDDEGLAKVLKELEAEGELEATAFSMNDLNELLLKLGRLEGETFDVEAAMAAAPDQVANTKPGDIWQLGRHRLMCGDSTKVEDVEKLMGQEKANAVITDPPYGINRQDIENDDPEGLPELFQGTMRLIPCTDAIAIIFQSPRLFPIWLTEAQKQGWTLGRALWWYEPFTPASRTRAYPWHGWYMQGEIILVLYKGQPRWPNRCEFASDTYLHEFGEPRGHEAGTTFTQKHPTLKPLWIVRSLVEHTSGLVCDPFLGSGTTLIAAEQAGRICYGMEIVPHYCDVAIARWEAYTGEQAVLAEEREMAYA